MIRSRGRIRMMTGVSRASSAAVWGATTQSTSGGTTGTIAWRIVVVIPESVTGFSVSLVNHQVDRHFTFEATDVSLTEVVAQFVDLHFIDHKARVQMNRRRWHYCVFWPDLMARVKRILWSLWKEGGIPFPARVNEIWGPEWPEPSGCPAQGSERSTAFLPDLLRKDLDVFIERFWRTDVSASQTRFAWGTSGQFTLLEYQGQQRKERMAVDGIFVTLAVSVGHPMVGHNVISILVHMTRMTVGQGWHRRAAEAVITFHPVRI